MNISMKVLPSTYAMLKVESLSDLKPEMYKSEFYVVAQSKEEISVVCQDTLVPNKHLALSPGWKLLKFQGTLNDGLIGVVSAITKPLADAGISVIANTTYDAGYFGVVKDDVDHAIGVLRDCGINVEQ